MHKDQPHIPVLLDDVLAALAPVKGGRYLDGTFGAGGYTRAILDAAEGVEVLAIDRDPDAMAAGAAIVDAYAGRLRLWAGPFGDLDHCARTHDFVPLDGIVLDIGVSSMQLDDPARGFSFRADGPLDMRMAQTGRSAADLVNTLKESELADLIYLYGEERRSRAVARAIVDARKQGPLTRTMELAGLVASVVRHKHDEIHPATRTFQALRIAVNDELGELERALEAATRVLGKGGRLVVVTFHSLEDRIVKRFLREQSQPPQLPSRLPLRAAELPAPRLALVGKLQRPDAAEVAANPRARSAVMRIAEKAGRS